MSIWNTKPGGPKAHPELDDFRDADVTPEQIAAAMALPPGDRCGPAPIVTVWVLRTTSSPLLDGYVFRDEGHAQEWMAQSFVRGGDYRLEIRDARRTRCMCPDCRGHVRLLRAAPTTGPAPSPPSEADR